MLRRNIDPDTSGPTFEEKLFHRGKIASIVLAVGAIGIAALDLVNANALTNISAVIRDSRMNYDEIPGHVLAGIRSISVYNDRSSVVVSIPRDQAAPKLAAVSRPSATMYDPVKSAPAIAERKQDIAKLEPVKPAPKAEAKADPKLESKIEQMRAVMRAPKNESPAVAALADVRHADAVETAMVQPNANVRPPVTFASLPVAAAASASLPPIDDDAPPVRLASLSAAALPSDVPSALPEQATITLPPINMVPLPIPAPGVPPPSPAQRLNLDVKEYAKAERCLANAIYWEARSEPVRGQMAVAQVVMNRVFSPFYPKDVCSVVYQNAHRHLSCQFTFACDGKRKTITERGHWARANRIAKQTLDGQIYVPEVAKSTHYHASYVNPIWNREMKKLVKFGLHSFYRPWAWGNGDDMPAWGKPSLAKTAMARHEPKADKKK